MKLKTKIIEKINETESWFFEKINKTETSLARVTKRKKERIQMINIRNKTGYVTTDTIDAKMIIRKCYEQLFTHKFDNLDEIHPFLEKYKLPQLTQYKIYNLKNSVTIKEIEFVIFKTHPPYQKSPGPDSFTEDSTTCFNTNFSLSLLGNGRGENTTQFIL